jgi:aspartate 1-decarboxylase
MLISICRAKIHRATLTDCNLNYKGSITIDAELLRRSGILPFEKVQIANINNGERFETYVIEGLANSGVIALNGAAARKGEKGDLIIIIAYGLIEVDKAKGFTPAVVQVDANNRPVN